MKRFFRYDYNRRMFVVMNLISIGFLALSFLALRHESSVWWLTGVAALLGFGAADIYVYHQGIRIKNNKVIIMDYLPGWFGRKFELSMVKYVELEELKKEKRSNLYGFFHEFYHANTYMFRCDYVYNHGRVFNIVFHLKDGSRMETYFGWLYREKNEKTVARVCKSLETFINEINEYVKEERKSKRK